LIAVAAYAASIIAARVTAAATIVRFAAGIGIT